MLACLPLKKTKHGWLLTSCFCLYNICKCTVLVPVRVLFACIYRDCAQFCLHAIFDVVCLSRRCGTLTNTAHLAVSKQPDTLSPSVCIMFLALPLFLFAGRAKAEPARQTTTKRRKRKNSASSANSSVGTTAGKKRSPATNFSLSSQVPVSISSVCLFISTFFSVTQHSHGSCKHTDRWS